MSEQKAPSSAAMEQQQQQQQHEQKQSATSEAAPAVNLGAQESSCRKKKSESGTFLGDVISHIDEFVNASLDDHKTCFSKTLNKMFGMSKAVSNGAGTTSASASVPVENVMSRPATTE